ncbi:MAG: hypothetical protein CYPHOPRED_005377 [Cyphobasidiales sp. Tagirdzhanova-0007]|nr:MAG: hypothetical protein CYPHOPRED_005377 [Cyphobasidiales sp. Tagirdzhanova-0007]
MAADYKATCIIHPGNHFLFCNTASRHGAETGSMVLGRNAALRVHSIGTLLFYMLLLFTIGVLYEYLRLLPAQLESALRSSESYKTKLRSSSDVTRTPLLSERERSSSPSLYNTRAPFSVGQKALRSLLYTGNVAMSFFLMLVIMTYNSYLIAAVLAGAFVGHFMFHGNPGTEMDRGMACH